MQTITLEDMRSALAAVAACPDRGAVLPVSQQPHGCHRCGELTACRLGRGRWGGAATMEDCVRCVTGQTPVTRRDGPGTIPPEAEALLKPRPYEDMTWLRRRAKQGNDPTAEARRYATVPPPSPPDGRPVVGYLHVGILGTWRPILMELLSQIERSGLAGASRAVLIGTAGDPDTDLSWLPQWATVVVRAERLDMGENTTLAAMRAMAKAEAMNPETASPLGPKIWYVHTKGASHPGNLTVESWRDYLAHWNILHWRECAAALDDHDAAGVDFANGTAEFQAVWNTPITTRGFIGNFWWANSRYIADMPDDQVILDRDRWDAEWNFVGAGNPRVKIFHNSRHHFYSHVLPRGSYDPTTPPD